MSALESRGFVGDYGDRAAPRLTSEDSYKRKKSFFYFGFFPPLLDALDLALDLLLIKLTMK